MTNPTLGAGYVRGELSALPALQDAPELYRPLPAINDSETRANARRDQDFATRAAAGATALADRLRETQPDMADGLTEEMMRRFDEESAGLLDGAPSPAAEEAARAAVGRARGRFADRLLPEEAAARTVTRRQGLIDALAQFRAAAEADPDAVEALHAEGAAAIKGAADWLGAEEAGRLAGQWRHEVYERSLSRLIDDEPREASVRLSHASYRGALGTERQSELLHRAQARAELLTQDKERARQRARDQDDLRREAARWSFHADFAKSLRLGTARRRMLDDAETSGLITKFERQRLEPKLIENELASRDESASAAHVSEYLDGRNSAQPTTRDIAAHYNLVMKGVLVEASSEDRGHIYLDYLRALGRHELSYERGPLDTGLPPPTDAPVTARQMNEMLGFDPTGKGEVALSAERPVEAIAMAWRARRDFAAVEELFADLPTHNTPADAYRHAYWSFMATRERQGSQISNELLQSGHNAVKMFTDAHEVKTVWQTRDEWLGRAPAAQPLGERYMDIYNNAVGHWLALDQANAGRPARDVILQALEDGLLQTKPMTVISED